MARTDYHRRLYDKRKKEYQVLLGGKCSKCDQKENLEFDHIDPSKKSFVITANIFKKLADILLELKKCQLLCKRCHRDKTGKAKHGSLGMYCRHKCRCNLCKSVWNEYRRKQRARQKLSF